MIRIRTLGDNLAGAWQLMLGRPQGLDRIDTSVEGFWESFGAIVLIAPFAYISLLSQASLDAASSSGTAATPATDASAAGGGLFFTTLALLVDWFTFPVVFALFARPFGLASRYVPFIVARNWASVVVGAIVSIVHALHLLGVMPAAAMPYVLLVAVGVALRFSYMVAKITLAVTVAVALPIVILDFLLSLVIWSVFDRLT